MSIKVKFNKTERSWAMYDWANSVYATIICAAIFPIYFSSVAKAAGQSGDVLWGYATSFATLIVAISAPVLGSLGDLKGMKKKLLTTFIALGVIFTLLMAITDNIHLMLFGYIVSYIGFLGSLIFYDSFITNVTTEDKMDKLSAFGYALGYIGGSTIPFIASILLIMLGENLGISSTTAVKISVVITSLWWALFSIPILKNVKQVYYTERATGNFVTSTWKSILNTIKDIKSDKVLVLFLIAYFFYIDGVDTVINMSTSYGSTLGLSSTVMILALLVTQLLAVPFSIIYSRLAEKIGTINVLFIGIITYVVVCFVGFYMGYSLETASAAAKLTKTTAEYNAIYNPALKLSQILFWVLAILVSTAQGGIQALSRSNFGKLVPKERSSEYFGFINILGKFSAIMGPALYAFSASVTGHSSSGVLSLITLFVLGGYFLVLTKRKLQK